MRVLSEKSAISPILVGRAADLQALEQLVAQSLQGTGRVAIVAGEAGIGKSRLVKELEVHASARGFLILRGSCFEIDRTLPYAPLADLLRNLTESLSLEGLSGRLGSSARELVKLLPELSDSVSLSAPSPSNSPELERRRLFDAIYQLLFRRSTPQPLLLVLEDLHWSDDSTLEFLQYLSHRLIGQPVLILLTLRMEEARPSLIHFIAELHREPRVIQVDLNPLSRADVQSMLRAIFHLDHPMRPDFVDAVCAIAEGNPFFIEEICKSLIQAGKIDYSTGLSNDISLSQLRIPLSVQDAVLRRSHELSKPAQRLLTLASVAGRRFDFSLLQELTDMHEEQLLRLLKELVKAQLVVEESADQFAFRHALTREAAYAGLLLRERKWYHRLIGRTIQKLYADNLETHVTDLAYHSFHSEEWTSALEYSRRAGQQAQLLYAPREAQEHFSRALEAAQHLESQPPLELYRARGQAADMLGDFERAKADFEQALALARERTDRLGEWRLLIHLGFLWASRDYDKAGEYFERALGLARSIGDPDLVARSLNRVGNWYVNIDRPGEGLRRHQEALDTFQELGDRKGIAETLDLMGMASYLNGDLKRGVSYYERAVALFQELDDRQGLTSSLALLSQRAGACNFDIVVTPGGTLRQAAREGDQALKIAREIGYRAGEAFALAMLGMLWGAEGDYGRALNSAQLALEIAEEIHHRQWQSAAHCALGAIEVEVFAFDTARSHLERALDLAQQTRSTYWIANATRFLARGYSLQGDGHSAEIILSTIPELSRTPETQAQLLLWTANIDVALAQGNPRRALDLTNELIASVPGITEKTVIPSLWYLRGRALLALQRPQEAVTVLRPALQAASQQGARSVLWRIYATLGEAEQMQDEPKPAQAEFAAAGRLVKELAGTIPGGGFREEFLRRAGELIPGFGRTPRIRAKTIAELTPREQQVATLIAKGKSNRAIAETLVLSERTVETHVSSILSKLGATSRTQIAVWAKEKAHLAET